MSGKYDDIIDLPHHVSATRPRMPAENRAAQFAPFAALVGYGDAVKEAGRLTDERTETDENEKDALNERLMYIADHIKERPLVEITYFRPDAVKSGGAYVTANGTVKKTDEYARTLTMSDGTVIPVDDIVGVTGDMFDSAE